MDKLVGLFESLNINKVEPTVDDLMKSFNNLNLHSDDINDLIDIMNKLKLEDKYICAYHNSDKSICRIYDCHGHNNIIKIFDYTYVC